MANKQISMLQIKKALQLLEEGRSERSISTQLKLSRNTLRHYQNKFQTSGLSYSKILALSDTELSFLIYGELSKSVKTSRQEQFDSLIDYFLLELKRVGVTRQLLWKEYLQQDPDGYGYSQFCDRLNQFRIKSNMDVTMHLDHVAGERMQVDFAGKKLSYVDKDSGEEKQCPVLVCTLPFSGYTYVEALANASQRNLYESLGRCLSYFQGVPSNVLSDNMKQFVDKASRYEPRFNEMAQQWSVYYNTTLSAARVRKPKDKPSVEKEVHNSYLRIFAPLRNTIFYSLQELNYSIFEQLDKHNATPMQRYGSSRKERFEQQEKYLLKPLPLTEFVVKQEVKAKVQRNYHVILGEDMHQYSVPYTHVGETVKIVYDYSEVEIFLNMRRIALHSRSPRRNGYSTKEEHMPERHLRYKETKGWNADYFISQASKIGDNAAEIFKRILARNKFPEQTYNACLGLLSLSKKYGYQRFEAACKHALPAAGITYGLMKNILANNQDKIVELTTKDIYIPEHENLRGKDVYRN
ncbi:IS21 family transposase [Candidatus Parcubacteria bacterium]|nr:IS21 family transposase [Planctomycetota bacterium]MCG2687708.1 IS21 family transposase [Candidatus Parcubacteria bacterium]